VRNRKSRSDYEKIKRSAKYNNNLGEEELPEVSDGYECRKTEIKGEKNRD